MGSANDRRRYIVTSSVIDWARTQNDPCVGRAVYGQSWELIYQESVVHELWKEKSLNQKSHVEIMPHNRETHTSWH